jgi:type II secretory pathway component HofQ
MELSDYPDLMTKKEVAEVLRCRTGTVPRLKGLKKTFLLNGRKGFGYRKQDVIDYIDSKVQREEVIKDANNEKKRHRKMGIPSLLSWEQLQKARVGNPG